MSDMRATWILRASVTVLLFIAAAVFCGIGNAVLHDLLSVPTTFTVEGAVMSIIVGNRLWDWSKRRAWIGSPSTRSRQQ